MDLGFSSLSSLCHPSFKGQIAENEEGEPAKKKAKLLETKDKYETAWRKTSGDESPLLAPPDSPNPDSPTSMIDPSSRLVIDSPVLMIVETPASPTMDSPASPIQESPASPVMDSPSSPDTNTPKAILAQRTYAPVGIPAASTVTFTRRDPRTAASRSSGPPIPNPGSHNTVTYSPLTERDRQQKNKILPKSILMKPSSSVVPSLYGISSRFVAHTPTCTFVYAICMFI